MHKPVTIYTTPTCHFCQMAKEFFQANGVEYTEVDVAANVEKRQEMIDKSGQMGVPVIFVGDEMVVGFDKRRLMELLDIKEAAMAEPGM
jgi:glutaredoxin 3